jgi:membrane associated rhomboid family serine protease
VPLTRPPWDKAELFALRPEQPEYGYVVRGVRHGCTREELVARCRAARPHVDLVWTPEFPRLIPPAEVPWLLDAVRGRTRENLRYNLKNGLALTLVFSALAAIYFLKGYPLPLLAVIVVMMGVVPTVQPAMGLWRMRKDPDGYTREQAGILRYQMWLGTRRAAATMWLGAGLVLVGAAQMYAGIDRSIAAAGLVKTAVRDGEVWRLLTCEMLHGNAIHFIFNFLALLALGRLLEMHGHPLYLPTVFLFSALCASAASFYLTRTTSIGASGGIMGLVGFLAVIGLRRRHVVPRGFLKSIAASVALTAGTGLVAHEFIDNAAHAGGLLGGLLLGAVYVTRHGGGPGQLRLTPSLMAKVAGYVSTAAIAGTVVATVWLGVAAARASHPVCSAACKLTRCPVNGGW